LLAAILVELARDTPLLGSEKSVEFLMDCEADLGCDKDIIGNIQGPIMWDMAMERK
jgi:hypothetical protein